MPLDFFDEILADVGPGPLTLIGSSKGAELAANLAGRYPEVDNLVLYAPAEYTFAGCDQYSSFTWRGEPVSYRASHEAAAAQAPDRSARFPG